MKKTRKGLAIALLTLASGATLLYAAACGGKTVEYTFSTEYSSQANVQVKEGETYTLPVLSQEGYSFEGWYLSSDYSGSPVTSVVASENATYYAKWEKMYKVTLDLANGTLSGATSFYLKPGASVYEAVETLAPTKGDLKFGGWFRGSGEVGANLTMPKQDITLTAKYKAAYTIQLFGQTLEDATVYESIGTITDYAYVGSEYEANERPEGFTLTYNTQTVDTVTISETASDNVMKLYYKRNDITVTFHSNYPTGTSESDIDREKIKFGQKVEIPSDYVLEGYCLLGWSTSKGGEVEHSAYYLDNVLYGGEPKENDTHEFKKDTTLYAVWAKGYEDMFGGNDYIFHLAEDSTTVYLARGGVFFEGTYNPVADTFTIKNTQTNKTLLRGRWNDKTGSFLYFDRMNSEEPYYLYRAGEVLYNVKIEWGVENDLKYYDGKGNVLKGTYTLGADNAYVVTFTTGEKMTIVLGVAPTSDGATVSVFQIRNDEESKLKDLVRLAVYEGGLNFFYPTLSLDGFGNATLASSGASQQYYYTIDGETVTLINKTTGSVYGYARLQTAQGVDGYIGYTSYEPDLAQEFALGENESLTLNGLYNATYKNGTEEISGLYETISSAMGGMIVKMYAQVDDVEQTYIFYVAVETVEVPDTSAGAQEGATITQTQYTVSKKTNAYKEYYFKDETYLYYAPLMIVDSEAVAGKTEAVLYDYTANNEYIPAVYGYYTYDEATKLYTFTVERIADGYDASISKSPYTLSEIKSFVFAFNTAGSYNVHYWYSLTQGEDQPQNFATEYKAANNDDKLTFVAGFAVYATTKNEVLDVKTGTYVIKDGYVTLTFTDKYNQQTTMYVALDEKAETFEVLLYEPYTTYLRAADGTTDKDTYLVYDGKNADKATYVANGTEKEITISEVGTHVGKTIYSFTVDSTTYQFLQWSKSKFSFYDATYAGHTYRSDFGTLTFDGYGYRAEYTDDVEGSMTSEYTVVSENVIRMMIDGVRYVDLKVENGSYIFTLRGLEYGKVKFVDNQLLTGAYIEFNGYGAFTYYEKEGATGKSGTYEKDGDVITLTFAGGEVWTGEYSNSRGLFILSYKNVVNVYVNEKDWSVLTLDEFGNATKYTANGEKEYGYYTLITEDLLYYINKSNTYSCIYQYDMSEETATPIQPDEVSYYNANFESLHFTEYGFAIFNGTTQYFFNEEDDGTVYIYRLPEEGETPNTAYGYMEIEFGTFSQETVVWGEDKVTYYLNEGSKIDFVRATGDAENYPVAVSETEKAKLGEINFKPVGTAEFTVNCTMTLLLPDNSTQDIKGQLTRDILEDGTVETYFTYGYYRWDVTLNFNGMDSAENAYTITRMRYIQEIPSYQYLQNYYSIYVDSGSAAANAYENKIGVLLYCTEFQTNGEPTEEGPYMMGSFGEDSNMYDMNGKLVSFEKGTAKIVNGGISQVVFENKTEDGGDGYTYCLYFVLVQHQAFKVPGYVVYAFTRVQEFTADDTYTLSVGRVISSDYQYVKAGSIFSVELKLKEGELVPENAVAELLSVTDTKFYYVVRTVDKTTKKITSSTYYEVTLTKADNGAIEEEGSVGLYKDKFAVNVIKTINTVYNAKGDSYVDIDTATKTVMSVNVEGRAYAVEDCTVAYGTYTVKTTSGYVFEITVADNVATIVDVTEQTEQA